MANSNNNDIDFSGSALTLEKLLKAKKFFMGHDDDTPLMVPKLGWDDIKDQLKEKKVKPWSDDIYSDEIMSPIVKLAKKYTGIAADPSSVAEYLQKCADEKQAQVEKYKAGWDEPFMPQLYEDYSKYPAKIIAAINALKIHTTEQKSFTDMYGNTTGVAHFGGKVHEFIVMESSLSIESSDSSELSVVVDGPANFDTSLLYETVMAACPSAIITQADVEWSKSYSTIKLIIYLPNNNKPISPTNYRPKKKTEPPAPVAPPKTLKDNPRKRKRTIEL